MKTPKRYPATMSVYATRDELRQDRARWKRKNKIAQLKRSLEKYKYGTHLSGSVAAAYRRLQSMVRPGRHAAFTKWANYLNELHQIQEHITCAITNTAILLAYDAERKSKRQKGAE